MALPVKAHICLTLETDTRRSELALELATHALFHRHESGFDIGEQFRGKVAEKGTGLIDACIGENHAERREDARLRRNNDLRDV